MATPTNGSVQLGFSILRQFATPPGHDSTLSEVARAMGLPVPTVHRFLKTLVAVGALAVLPGGRYTLGAQLADLGGLVRYETLLSRSAQAVIATLARRLQVTVHLSVLDAGMAKFIAKESGDPAFRVDTRVGARFEPYCTASGKVLLASLSASELDDYLDTGALVPLTRQTVTDPDALIAAVRDTRRRALAIDREEFQDGVACLAVPVRNSVGRPVAALSTSFDAARGDLDSLASALADASRAITASLAARAEAAEAQLSSPSSTTISPSRMSTA